MTEYRCSKCMMLWYGYELNNLSCSACCGVPLVKTQ